MLAKWPEDYLESANELESAKDYLESANELESAKDYLESANEFENELHVLAVRMLSPSTSPS